MRKIFWSAVFLTHFLVQGATAYDPKYLNEVVGRQAVSLGDGFELIMILLNLEDKYADFESQLTFLEENNLIQKSLLDKPAGTPLRRGELAYMLAKTLKLKGGFKARALGLNERFAMQELMYQGIMREGHRLDLVTGQELVVIMTQAGQHILERQGKRRK